MPNTNNAEEEYETLNTDISDNYDSSFGEHIGSEIRTSKKAVFYAFYKIGGDGFTPELVDSFSVVWHSEGEELAWNYFQKENEITEEEYKTNMQSYEVTFSAGLDWEEIY